MILIPPQVNHFEFFGIQIHFYSICIFFAIFTSLLTALKLSERSGMNADKNVILDFAPMLIVFSILGARIYYILLALNYYIKEPLRAFAVWEGGLSIHGAFIGGVLFGIWYFKKRKLNFFSYADIFAAVLPLGQAIGRWGNFFNSEAFGVPVSKGAPFALYVSEIFRPDKYKNFDFFSPVFLYESILDFLIFLFLLFLLKKIKRDKNQKEGIIFFAYILLYSSVRFILEFFRLDTVFYLFNIPFPVIISFLGILIGIFGIFYKIKLQKH